MGLRVDTLGKKILYWLEEYITNLVWRETGSQVKCATINPSCPWSRVLVLVVYHTPEKPNRETRLWVHVPNPHLTGL